MFHFLNFVVLTLAISAAIGAEIEHPIRSNEGEASGNAVGTNKYEIKGPASEYVKVSRFEVLIVQT